jgi:transcriptional regulator with PAS, ATPase and Fis domain
VAVNCAALPKDLIESELFGIEKGVATGVTERVGKFEQASGGTLFLDEIGDMRLEIQASILRALQEGTVFRVGGSEPRAADVRILAATNRDVGRLLDEGAFRLDLFHRIADWEVRLPALRERPRDIANLAAFFLETASRARGVAARGISRAALERLVAYPWPGNIRQLEREMSRAVLFLEDGDLVESSHLSDALRQEHADPSWSLKQRLEHFEREEIRRSLRSHDGSVKNAAAALGVATSTLYRRLKELGIPTGD